MLRFTIAILLAMLASGPAMSAERAVARHGVHRAAVMLPAGLPPIYSAAWHHVHLYAPRSINPDSNMPSYRFVWPATLLSKDLRSSLLWL